MDSLLVWRLVLTRVVISQSQDGFKLNVWDIGGQKAIRPYWKNYYEHTDGLVYVVDSSDDIRIGECTEELNSLLAEDLLAKVPLLVYANKQDIQGALEAPEVMEQLKLESIEDRNWNIQACSAITKEGLSDGMEWLIKTIGSKDDPKQQAQKPTDEVKKETGVVE